MLIGIIVGSIMLVAICCVCIVLGVKLKEIRKEYSSKNEDNKELRKQINLLRETLEEALVNAAKTEHTGDLDSVIEEKRNKIAASDSELKNLEKIIADKEEWRKKQEEAVKEEIEKKEKLGEEKEELELLLSQLRVQVQETQGEVKKLSGELNRLLEMKRATESDRDIRWDPELDGREIKLLDLIREIEELYPDLKADLANIEWKRIWLPKMQESCRGLDGVRGIYRLVLKENEEIGYVGQALNIKDRWYQHVKKMIGAMAKGNEKLYRYDRPDMFWWTVVEEGNGVDLNESERYWIEYFGMGLNSKL